MGGDIQHLYILRKFKKNSNNNNKIMLKSVKVYFLLIMLIVGYNYDGIKIDISYYFLFRFDI